MPRSRRMPANPRAKLTGSGKKIRITARCVFKNAAASGGSALAVVIARSPCLCRTVIFGFGSARMTNTNGCSAIYRTGTVATRRELSKGVRGNFTTTGLAPIWRPAAVISFDVRHGILSAVRAFTNKHSTGANSTGSTGRRGFPTGSATAAAFRRRRNC